MSAFQLAIANLSRSASCVTHARTTLTALALSSSASPMTLSRRHVSSSVQSFRYYHPVSSSMQQASAYPSTSASASAGAASTQAAATSMSFMDKAKHHGAASLVGAPFPHRGGFDSFLSNMQIVSLADGVAVCHLVVSQSMANSYNTLHGGVTTTLIDVVGTLALLSVDQTRGGVSVDLNCNFLSAVKVGEEIEIRGKVLKAGKTLGFTQVDIVKVADGKMVATGRHTKAL